MQLDVAAAPQFQHTAGPLNTKQPGRVACVGDAKRNSSGEKKTQDVKLHCKNKRTMSDL